MSDIQIEFVNNTIEIETPYQIVEFEVPRFVHIDNSYWPAWPQWPAWPTWPTWPQWPQWIQGIQWAIWPQWPQWIPWDMMNPMTTLWDIIYGGTSWTPTSLWGNTTTDTYVLWSVGNGTNATAPSWLNLTSTLANYVTNSSLSGTLSSYVTNSSLSSTLSSYVTNSSLSSTLSSYVTNSSLSSTLSWYQTAGNYITALTWDITASWPWSASATIASQAVTFSKFQNISTSRLLWRSTTWSWSVEEISIWSWLSLSAWVLSATWWWGWTPWWSNTQVQFNDSWSFGWDSWFTYNKTTKAVTVNSAILSRPSSGTVYLGSYPSSIVSPNNGTAIWLGAAVSVTSASSYFAWWYNCANTATTQISFIALWAQAFLNACATRWVAIWFNSQANNTGNDTYWLWSLAFFNATNEVWSVGIGTNVWIWSTTWFWNVAIWDTSYAAWWASWGNTIVGRGAWATVWWSFGASRNTIVWYASDISAWLTWSIVLWAWWTATASNIALIWWTVSAITDLYLGRGVTDSSPIQVTIQSNGASGTNINGSITRIAWWKWTGTGTPWRVYIATSTAWLSWTTLQSLTNRRSVSHNATIREDWINMSFNTTTGTKIGTSASEKIALWNKTPIVQPTTAITWATLVSPWWWTNIKTDDTFGGYTIAQVIQALINLWALA